jgi:hypothetical protein
MSQAQLRVDGEAHMFQTTYYMTKETYYMTKETYTGAAVR